MLIIIKAGINMYNTSNYTGRFAPSPSGSLHLGNIATFLLAWLDVRSSGGKLIFRMEDLDPDRSFEKYKESITSDLLYLGLKCDEGWGYGNNSAYEQSCRTKLYEDVFDKLNSKGLVYPCYCTRSKRLAARAVHAGDQCCDPNCNCKYLSKAEKHELEAAGRRPAWKIRVPDKEIRFSDGHFGMFSENIADSGDFIIKRSDGVFAYQLAVSFDDMQMGINRVVRGRDLLSSTARQIWLIGELGGSIPSYCHTPLIVTDSDRKMSKRFGDLSMEVMRNKYRAEEIIGHISKLLNIGSGSPCTADDLIDSFSWDNVPANDILYIPK